MRFAAGLFVDPDPGPVLANYGLDTLRFIKPIQPGETIKVRLTAKDKSPRNKQYGEVRWDVEIMSDKGETGSSCPAALFSILFLYTWAAFRY